MLRKAGVQISQVEAYTNSTWAKVELAVEWQSLTGEQVDWDGRIEAFNGEVVRVRPVHQGVRVTAPLQWQSSVEGSATAGVIATVRYACNEDANSFDRTIVTVRSPVFGHSLEGFSCNVDDALAEPVYVRDLGVHGIESGAGDQPAGARGKLGAEPYPYAL